MTSYHSNILNYNESSFRQIPINDLSAINIKHDLDDVQDPNTSVLSVHDNLENLISSHRMRHGKSDEDEDDELYNPSVSGLLSLRDSPINTDRDFDGEKGYARLETSKFNNNFLEKDQKYGSLV